MLSAPAFWSACGGPASHHRRGRAKGNGEGCDHADGTPAASLFTGRTRQRRASRGSPPDVFRCARGCRNAPPGKTSRTARPREAPVPRDPERHRARSQSLPLSRSLPLQLPPSRGLFSSTQNDISSGTEIAQVSSGSSEGPTSPNQQNPCGSRSISRLLNPQLDKVRSRFLDRICGRIRARDRSRPRHAENRATSGCRV